MDQGRYGEEKDREESSYQGSYGAQAESWVCPACETVNSQDKCVVCGYQNEPKVDKVTSERKKRPHLVWAIAACLVAVVFLALSVLPRQSAAEPPQNKDAGQITENKTVVEGITEESSRMLMSDTPYGGIELGDDASAPVFGSNYQRQQIASITFLATTKGAASDNWDVSQSRDRTVLAWVEPNGDLYDLYIGAEGGVLAPEDCTCLFLDYINLRQIEFNDAFDTANVTFMSSMFDGCSSLTELDVSGFDTINVTFMESMFNHCSSLTELDVSSFDTANVTSMYAMFDNCSSLTTLDVSGFDTTNVTDMGGMFGNCSSLTELDVSSFDTANVTSMYAIFYNCSSLTALDVADFDTAKVTNIGFMFCGCSNLTELDVSHFDVSKVKDYEAFMDYGRTINGRPWEEFFRTQ